MNLRTAALGLTVALALPGQNIAYRNTSDPELQKHLLTVSAAASAQGILVLLDGSGPLGKTLQEALKAEGLQELELTTRPLDPGLSKTLRETFHWAPGPRWAFLDRNFTVRATGDAASTPAQIQAQLVALKLTAPFQRIQAFALRNPDRLDAQLALLEGLGSRASRRMEVHLKPVEGDRPAELFILGATLRRIQADRQLLKPLSPEEDARIWGDYVRQFTRVAAAPDWTLNAPALPQGAELSPQVQALARKLLPPLEEALAHHPHDGSLWRLAAQLQRCAGRTDLLALGRRLEPVPGRRALPPLEVYPEILAQLRKRQAWEEIRDLLLPQVQVDQTGVNSVAFVGNWGAKNDFYRGIWNQTLSPLVEALLHLKERETADGIVRKAAEQHGTGSFPIWASQLALQCGERDLALAWSSLRIEEKGRS